MAQQINLFDPALLRKRDWFALTNVVVAGCLMAAVVIAAGFSVRASVPALTAQVATNEAQLKALREEVVRLGQQMSGRKADPRIEQDIATARQLLALRGEMRATLEQQLASTTGTYADYLRGFARQTVPGLWLTGLSFYGATHGMEIEGRMTDPTLLPEYIRRLNQETAFQGRAFAALQMAEGKPEPAGATATGAPAAATPHPAPPKRSAFHEFRLIPVKPPGKSEGDKSSPATMGGAS